MAGVPPGPHTAGLHAAEKAFATFAFALAGIGLFTFWPPVSAAIVGWLVVWTTVCLAAGVGILRRARHAAIFVWALIILAGLSAVAAFRDGLLQGVGILIDALLMAPMVLFAIWYQRRR